MTLLTSPVYVGEGRGQTWVLHSMLSSGYGTHCHASYWACAVWGLQGMQAPFHSGQESVRHIRHLIGALVCRYWLWDKEESGSMH